MVDITDPGTRSRMMARIRGRDTGPEMAVRRALRSRGLFYRLHVKDLPGRPDIVFRSRKVCVFVHGCFWHQHGALCTNSSMPASSAWQAKLQGNVMRDARSIAALTELGWRVAVVWECSIRSAAKRDSPAIFDKLARWIEVGRSGKLEL